MSETDLRGESSDRENGDLQWRAPSPGWWGNGRVIWRLVALALGLIFLYAVRDILPPFILAGMVAFLLAPAVSAVEGRLRVPRGLAVLLTMLLALVPLAVVVALAAPMLVRESSALIRRGPALLTEVVAQVLGTRQIELFGQFWTTEELSVQLTRAALDWMGGSRAALHVATIALETMIFGLVILVATFYLLLDQESFGRFVLSLFPPAHRSRVRRVAHQVNSQLRRYLVGLLFLVCLMSTVTWIGLTFIFHQPYALAVAVTTGVLEIIPLAGPIVAGGIAVLVAVTHGGMPTVVGVVIMYFILRQLEDQIVIPLVQKSAVQVIPLATIFGVIAGGAAFGILGMLLAVPALVVLKVVRATLMEDEKGVTDLSVADEVAEAEVGAAPVPPAPGRSRASR